MAKKEKVKKAKETSESAFKSYDEAKKAKDVSTKALSKARVELKTFIRETGLKKGKNYSKDKKHGKAWSVLNDNIESLEKDVKTAIAFMKSNKPEKPKKSKGGTKVTKYNYPDEITSIKDKDEQQLAMKKFRTEMRGRANRAKVSVDEYLADPESFDKKVEAEKKEKPSKKEKTPKEPKKGASKKKETKVESEKPTKNPKPAKKEKPSKKKKNED